MRVLVVFFSRTGYTRRIAEEIAAACDAELEAVSEARSRSGIWGYLRSAREAVSRRKIDILPAAKNPAHYDVVVVGTPVWAGNISSPVRAYLIAHREELKRLAVFCTQGGSGADKVVRDITALCGRSPIDSLVLTNAEIDNARYREKLDRFIASLRRTVAA